MKRNTIYKSFLLAGLVLSASVALADWNEGLSAFDAGNYEVAVEHFTEITRTNPTWPGGYYMLGRCQVAQEQNTGAILNLQKAVDLDPSDGKAIIALSQVLIVEEKFGDIRKLLENADTKTLPAALRSRATILLAAALLGENDAQTAVILLQERLGKDDSNSALYQILGKAQTATGDREGAFLSFSRAFELNPDESSGTSATKAALALAVSAGDDDERAQWYQKALETGTQLATSFPKLKYDLMAGEAALGVENLDSAELWFRAAVSKDENDPHAQYSLGRTLVSIGKDAEAYDSFSRALAALPDENLTRRIHGRMGRLAACRLDLEIAEAHYRAAQKEDQAQQIEDLATQYAAALTHRQKLRDTVHELQRMALELENLGDVQGVAAMHERIAAERTKITEIENNLEAVRSALCQ